MGQVVRNRSIFPTLHVQFTPVSIGSLPFLRRPKSPTEDIPDEDRDRRTVFCMQLSQRVGVKELEEFLSQAGKVGGDCMLCVGVWVGSLHNHR